MFKFSWLLASLSVATVGCKKAEPPRMPAAALPQAQAAAPAPVALPASASPAGMPVLATATVGGPQPDDGQHACEVELSGDITVAIGPNESRYIYVATGDCLNPTGIMRGRELVPESGSFFIEVFPPCGSDLTVCATIEANGPDMHLPKPTSRYGKLDRVLHADGAGEIEFKDLHLQVGSAPELMLKSPWNK